MMCSKTSAALLLLFINNIGKRVGLDQGRGATLVEKRTTIRSIFDGWNKR